MKPTERQLAALHFCEEVLCIEYNGNLDDRYEVSTFLADCLDDAKCLYEELKCEYEAYMNDLYND